MSDLLKRNYYLEQLIKGKDLNLIKVITGMRRSGKSILLQQFKEYLQIEKIPEQNIIYMNFESAEWYNIKNFEDLYKYIESLNVKGRKYILLDEVQNVLNWEKAVNAMLVDMDCDIYITGSNAYLLSSELTTLLAGRIFTIKMYPFSFREFLEIYPFSETDDKYDKFEKYLKYGGLPMLVNLNDDEQLIINYLNDIRDVVLKKDVITRNSIKDVVFLDNLIKYMASCIGNLTNPKYKCELKIITEGWTKDSLEISKELFIMIIMLFIYLEEIGKKIFI